MQSPSSNPIAQPAPPEFVGMMSLTDLAILLIKHNGISDGLFNASIEFNIGVGEMGPTPSSIFPCAMIGVSRVGLSKVAQAGPNTVDAAIVNPAKKPRSRK